jgi:hypothetical protein
MQLWKYWLDFAKRIKNRTYDAIFLLGEHIDGPGPKTGGREQKTTDLLVQRDAVLKVYHPLLQHFRGVPKYLFSGSGYHQAIVQRVMDIDRTVAESMPNATYVGVGPWGYQLGNHRLSLNHGGGTVYWYRATKADKIGFGMQLAEAGKGWDHIDAAIVGHSHIRLWLEYEWQIVAFCPCWKVQDDYARLKDPYKMVPDLGALEVWSDPDEHTLQHRFHSYRHPERDLVNTIKETNIYEWKKRSFRPILPPTSSKNTIKKKRGTLEPNSSNQRHVKKKSKTLNPKK